MDDAEGLGIVGIAEMPGVPPPPPPFEDRVGYQGAEGLA